MGCRNDGNPLGRLLPCQGWRKWGFCRDDGNHLGVLCLARAGASGNFVVMMARVHGDLLQVFVMTVGVLGGLLQFAVMMTGVVDDLL